MLELIQRKQPIQVSHHRIFRDYYACETSKQRGRWHKYDCLNGGRTTYSDDSDLEPRVYGQQYTSQHHRCTTTLVKAGAIDCTPSGRSTPPQGPQRSIAHQDNLHDTTTNRGVSAHQTELQRATSVQPKSHAAEGNPSARREELPIDRRTGEEVSPCCCCRVGGKWWCGGRAGTLGA